jgi:hypothetical protein
VCSAVDMHKEREYTQPTQILTMKQLQDFGLEIMNTGADRQSRSVKTA